MYTFKNVCRRKREKSLRLPLRVYVEIQQFLLLRLYISTLNHLFGFWSSRWNISQFWSMKIRPPSILNYIKSSHIVEFKKDVRSGFRKIWDAQKTIWRDGCCLNICPSVCWYVCVDLQIGISEPLLAIHRPAAVNDTHAIIFVSWWFQKIGTFCGAWQKLLLIIKYFCRNIFFALSLSPSFWKSIGKCFPRNLTSLQVIRHVSHARCFQSLFFFNFDSVRQFRHFCFLLPMYPTDPFTTREP